MADETLEKTGPQGLARPSFYKGGDTRGTENITKDDINMPRLGIAQAQTPQAVDGDPKRIEGLKAGDFFNTLTGAIIPKPLSFTVIRAERPRYIEFIPRTEGGGIRDYNVPADDPRTQFRTGPDGKSLPPIATKFYDFIILMLPLNQEDPMSSVIALSFKSMGLKTARTLNGLIKLRNAPAFLGKYTLTTTLERNAKGQWHQPQVANAGWVTEEEFQLASMIYDSLSGKTVSIDVSDLDVDEAEAGGAEPTTVAEGAESFDTSRM